MSAKDKKKPVAKKPAPKAAAKPVKPVAKSAATKSAAKPVVKPTAKPAAKPAGKPVAKPVAKSAPVAKSVARPAPAAKPAVKPMAKSAPAAKPVAKPAPAAKPVAKSAPATKPVAKSASAAKPVAKPVSAKPVAAASSKPASKPVAAVVHDEPKVTKDVKPTEVSILLKTFKLVRTPFFFEVIEAEERNNKKKYSSDAKLPEKPTVCVRNRSSLVEETPEELIERLAQELEEENFGMMREFGSQMCTKCGVNSVSMEFRVDKDLGYCEECADILRLGQSKEARKSDYQMSLMKRDPLAADADDGDGDAEGGTVDEEELEELEED